jgi:NAD(P)-dependent dehydrogenase (short-subunit alcohol dehydrogenase family)
VADLFSLTGETVLVTGASGGLGEHFARVAAAAGARVIIAARRRDRVEALAKELKGAAVVMDVTDEASVTAVFAAAEKVVGPVTVLVNNAGVAVTERATDITEASWDHVLDTNLKGAFLCARTFARRLMELNRGGVIVNVASILGLRVAPALASYAVSKAGLVQLTQALALELARHGIRVNALAPGYVVTDMNREYLESPAAEPMIKRIPQRRVCQPQDLDGAFLLLASDASRAMTGTVIPVDGGHLLSGV